MTIVCLEEVIKRTTFNRFRCLRIEMFVTYHYWCERKPLPVINWCMMRLIWHLAVLVASLYEHFGARAINYAEPGQLPGNGGIQYP